MYSVMAILKAITWRLFEYTESGAQRLFDHPVFSTLLLSPFVTPQVQLRKQSFSSECTTVLNFQKLSDYTASPVSSVGIVTTL